MGDHELVDDETPETEEEQEDETTSEESQGQSEGEERLPLGHPEYGWPAFEDR